MRSTNMLERYQQELRRRTRVVRIFPNEGSCLRLVTALAIEASEEWLVCRYLRMEAEEVIPHLLGIDCGGGGMSVLVASGYALRSQHALNTVEPEDANLQNFLDLTLPRRTMLATCPLLARRCHTMPCPCHMVAIR